MKNIKTGILGFYGGIMGCLVVLVTGLLILNPAEAEAFNFVSDSGFSRLEDTSIWQSYILF